MNSQPVVKETKGLIAWMIISIVWGTTYLAIRVGVEDLPPLLFAGMRWIAAGSILLVFLRLRSFTLPDKNSFFHLSMSGLLLLGAANGLVVVGEQWVPSGLAALLITTTPFWMVGMESFIPGGIKINLKVIAGLLTGFAGVILILFHDFDDLNAPGYLSGIVAIFFAVIFWSAGTLYSKHRKTNVHPLMGAAVQMFVAGIAQFTLGSLIGEFSELHYTRESFYSLLYLIIIGSLLGYTAYIYSLNKLPISFVSTYAYINPLIAVYLGWLFLDEKLNLFILLGSIITLAGVKLVRDGGKPKLIYAKRM